MEAPTKLLSVIAGSIVSVGTIYGVITFTHDKIQEIDGLHKEVEACREDVKQVRGNVILDEIKTEMRVLQDRQFKIEGFYGEEVLRTAPGVVREEYKQNKIDLDLGQQELKATQRAYKALR